MVSEKKKRTTRPRYSGKHKGTKSGKATSYTKIDNELQDRGFFQKNLWIIFPIIVLLAGLLVYSNTFHSPFVFDDILSITDNPDIKSFGALIGDFNFSRIFGYFTFALNYRLGGLSVAGYHIFNLSVHLSAALLVFWLVTLTFKTPFFKGSRVAESRLAPLLIALFSSLIFVAHPLQTQAVTYTVQRFASLSTLFYLLCLVMYAKWRLAADVPEGHSLLGHTFTISLRAKCAFFATVAIISALLAMLTKEIAFTLPVVVALWELSFFKGPLKKRLLGLLPLALTLPVVPLVLLVSRASLTQAAGQTILSPTNYFFTQLRVIVTYLRLMVLPTGQNLDYDYPVYSSPFELNVLLSFIFLLTSAVLGIFLWHYSKKGGDYVLLRLIAFGIFWFFITLSVESSFISIADVIFEHRLYLPSVGLIISAVAAAARASLALTGRLPAAGKAAVVLGAAVVVALGAATFERNRVWADPISLWADAAAKSPGKARPHHNLGIELAERSELERAVNELELALSVEPTYAKADSAFNILGRIYLERGEYDRAQYELTQAIALRNDFADAHNNLGVVYAKRGELDKAEAEYKVAIESDPALTDAYDNLGLNYIKQGRYSDAIGPYLKVIELDPGNSGAHNDLGNLYAMQGDYSKALSEYRAALAIDPNNQGARANIQRLQGMQSGAGAGGR